MILLPRILHSIKVLLEEEGVYGQVTLQELEIDFLPLDRDILSLELPQFTKCFYVNQDHTWIFNLARALWKLQVVFGRIPNVFGFGTAAPMVYEMSLKIIDKMGDCKLGSHYEIGSLLIFDRNIDMLSPLLSPLTYTSLLDEEFDINLGFVNLKSDVTGRDKDVKLLLNHENKVYAGIQDMHFTHVVSFLSAQIKELKSHSDKRKTMSIGEMKDFVGKDLKNVEQKHAAVSLHIGACEAITKSRESYLREQLDAESNIINGSYQSQTFSYIEDKLAKQESLGQCLRLMCMYSYCNGGISSKDYKSLKLQFLQSKGFEFLSGFTSLKKLGIFVDADSQSQTYNRLSAGKLVSTAANIANIFPRQSSFRSTMKKLGLIPVTEELDYKHPTCPSYVFGGSYIPLIPKLCDEITKHQSLSTVEDILKTLPGETVCDINAIKPSPTGAMNKPLLDPIAGKVNLVYFLGGVTYAEIAALRLIEQKTKQKFIIASTNITNGNTFIQSVFS